MNYECSCCGFNPVQDAGCVCGECKRDGSYIDEDSLFLVPAEILRSKDGSVEPRYKIGDRFGVWEVIGYLTNNCLTVYYLSNNLNQGKLTVDEDTLTRIFGVTKLITTINHG